MKKLRVLLSVLTMAVLVLDLGRAYAFCGFYVAKADTKLFNKASKVVLVRDGDRTVLTMANDYQGDIREFAIVIPVPTFLERDQIRVTENKYIEHLDAYTAPRLVEYFDSDPCEQRMYFLSKAGAGIGTMASRLDGRDAALGVTVEAEYTVGEYDILILSAQESDGLETWLRRNGYRIPEGASSVLDSYIRQNMRFFVAKVNLQEQSRLGYTYLRPLQVAFESPKFMLPIRLGTINADREQELFVFALTRKGRVETTNYRTVKIPSDLEIPVYVKGHDLFGRFYRDMFSTAVARENMRAVFLEYAWDMAWCDPCAADPLSSEELRQLGVFWETGGAGKEAAQNVFVTRLHLRYTAETFPEDLVFQQTGDRRNFQGRYILRHPWIDPWNTQISPRTPTDSRVPGERREGCRALRASYHENLPKQREERAQNLARLTGWDITEIRQKMHLPAPRPGAAEGGEWWKWWKNFRE